MNSLLLWDPITAIGDFFSQPFFTDFLSNVLAVIPKLIYFIVACVLSIIDLFQVMFRKLAGLDPIMISGETITGDSIYKIIVDALFNGRYPAISTAFWSLVILGVFMLIITSIIATIRLEYNPDKDKGNSKSAIIKNFFKALFSFAIVPIACIFGMALTNSFIGIIDSVTLVEVDQNDEVYSHFEQWQGITGTSAGDDLLMGNKNSYIAYDVFGITVPTTAEPFSGIVFKASAYSSNRFRKYGNEYLAAVTASGTDLGIFSSGQVGDYETAARIIDTGFAINANFKGGTYSLVYTEAIKDFYGDGLFGFFGARKNIGNFSKYNVELVWYFYDLWTFNYIIAFVAVLLIGKMYFNFCLTLMARVFEVAGLFLVSPVAISIMPMDGGGALDRWRKTFIGKFGLIIVMVFGLNIISPILAVVQEVKLFNLPLLDYIVLTFFIVAALSAVNGLNETISKIIFDKASAYDKDAKIAGATIGNVKSGMGMTMAAGKLVTAPAAMATKGLGHLVGYGIGRGANAIVQSHRASQDKKLNDKEKEHLRRQQDSMKPTLDQYTQDEKDALRDSIKYDETAGLQSYHDMSSDDRKDMADDFLATEAGRKFVDDYFGGNLNQAKNAIAYDQKPGKQNKHNFENAMTDASKAADARAAIARFAHDRQNFANTKEAGQYTEGTAAYREALGRYAALSDEGKVSAHVGGTALTQQQKDIQMARAAYEDTGEQAKKKIQEQYEAERKKIQERREGKRGIKKYAAEANERVVKPLTAQTNGAIQSILNLIPGAELFSKKKDK